MVTWPNVALSAATPPGVRSRNWSRLSIVVPSRFCTAAKRLGSSYQMQQPPLLASLVLSWFGLGHLRLS